MMKAKGDTKSKRLKLFSFFADKKNVKTPPTIEERLRNLLNSDAEGTESQSSTSTSKNTFDRPPTFELASRGCHGSYSPRLAESKMRVEKLNRTAGDSPSDTTNEVQKLKQRTRSLSSERSLTQERPRMEQSSSPNSTTANMRRTQTDALSNRLRRCVSAVPASFYDENWNVVPESPKRDEASNHSQFMFAPRSPVLSSTPNGRQTPTKAFNQAIWDQRPPPSPKRHTTLQAQRSDPRTPEGTHTRRTLEYTPSSLPMSAAVKFRDGSAARPASPLFHSRKNPLVTPLSALKRVNNPDDRGPCTPSPGPHSPAKVTHTVERKSRPIQYNEPPSPAYMRTTVLAAESGLKVSSLSSMSSHNSVPTPAKQGTMMTKQTTHSAAGKTVQVPNGGRTKVQTPDDEPESCKSEDRDSGAILDAEPSVFDFDSSVISESDDEASQNTQKLPKANSNMNQPEREVVWSRSSTPTLPPLSPYESDTETPRNSEQPDPSRVIANSSQPLSPVRNEVARLPSYESLLRKKRAQATKGITSDSGAKYDGGTSEAHDHHELSPTESALAESSDRKKAPLTTKTSEVKTTDQRNQRHLVNRVGSRASSADERRKISHTRHKVGKKSNRQAKGQKRNQRNSEEYTYYDIEDDSTQKLGRYPVFYKPGEDGVNGRRDADETSSMKSFTSASVASSVLRRNGRRHHKRHHGHSYAREVKAVNKRFSRLEAHVVTLARSVAQLSSEMREQSDTARDIEELRAQIEELRRDKLHGDPPSRKSSSSSRTKSECSRPALHLKSHPKRVVKLTKFFGEKPPILSLFLAQMGYEKYIDNFKSESITMVELPYMDEERLKSIGIPLGPRLRILNEAKKTCFV